MPVKVRVDGQCLPTFTMTNMLPGVMYMIDAKEHTHDKSIVMKYNLKDACVVVEVGGKHVWNLTARPNWDLPVKKLVNGTRVSLEQLELS